MPKGRAPFWAVAIVLLAAAGWYLQPARKADLAAIDQRLQAGQVEAAVGELKAVLKVEPDSGTARLLLGKALMASGDAAGAAVEFDRAASAGVTIDRVALPHSAALLALSRDREVITQYARVVPASAAAGAELQTLLAQAYANINEIEKSQQALAAALRLVPEFVPAILLKARQTAASGDLASAHAAVDGAIAKAPRDATAFVLKAELLRSAADGRVPAMAAYRQALALEPRRASIHAALLAMLIQGGELAAAHKQLTQMSQALPTNGLTQYFSAFLALRAGHAVHAREVSQRLLKAGVESAALYALAGQAEYLLGDIDAAEPLFGKAVALAPEAAAPRRQLAAVLLQKGQPQRALVMLQPLAAPHSKDALALALTGRALLARGDFAKADAAFVRSGLASASNTDPQALGAPRAIGLSQADAGLTELETGVAGDGGLAADLAAIAARLNLKDTVQALKLLDGLATRWPNSASLDELRGQIALLQGDRTAARQHFVQALHKAPGFTSSAHQLALMDLADNDAAGARARYEALLQRDPQNLTALGHLAELIRRTGGEGQAKALTDLLDKAVGAQPTHAALRLAVIDELSKARLHDAAMLAAQAAAAALPSDPSILERLAVLQMAAGEQAQALTNLRKLVAMLPRSAAVQLRLADALRSQGLNKEADERIRQAIKLDPEATATQLAAIGLALRQGQALAALEQARAIQSKLPDDALGFNLAGDIEARRGQWAASAEAYAQALKRDPPGNAAAGHHQALVQSGRVKEAQAFEQSWLKARPDDIAYRLFLADRDEQARDFAQSESQLRRVIELAPQHAGAYNNLSLLLHRQKLPGAKALAEQAISLAPDLPAARDTLATILADTDQVDMAIVAQLMAVKLAPQSGLFRLNLIKLHLRVGNKAKAREELDRMVKASGSFTAQPEVANLLAELGSEPLPTQMPVSEDPEARPPAKSPAAGPSPLQYLYFAVFGLAGLAAAVLLLAAVQPTTFRLTTRSTVRAPRMQVFNALQDFRHWEGWSGLPPFGPDFRRFYTGSPNGLHHRCQWAAPGEPIQGWLEIMQLAAPSHLVMDWCEDRPAELRHVHELVLTAVDSATTEVQWTVVGPAPYAKRVNALLSLRGWRLKRRLADALSGLNAAQVPASGASVAGAIPSGGA